MKSLLPLLLSAIVVVILVIVLGKKFKLSSRYERKPRILNLWNAQDHGLDPTDEKNI